MQSDIKEMKDNNKGPSRYGCQRKFHCEGDISNKSKLVL